MNDNELIATMREQRGTISMTVPLEQIVSRGRGVQTRRRTRGMAALLSVAAAVIIAVIAFTPAGHQPGRTVKAQVAGWTVSRQPDGSVRVTIRRLRHPARLQRALRADGIPANVLATFDANTPCEAYRGGLAFYSRVFSYYPAPDQAPGHYRFGVVVIHPAGLPAGAGVQLIDGVAMHVRIHGQVTQAATGVRLVYATPRCTGS